jgi:hypothetical protein
MVNYNERCGVTSASSLDALQLALDELYKFAIDEKARSDSLTAARGLWAEGEKPVRSGVEGLPMAASNLLAVWRSRADSSVFDERQQRSTASMRAAQQDIAEVLPLLDQVIQTIDAMVSQAGTVKQQADQQIATARTLSAAHSFGTEGRTSAAEFERQYVDQIRPVVAQLGVMLNAMGILYKTTGQRITSSASGLTWDGPGAGGSVNPGGANPRLASAGPSSAGPTGAGSVGGPSGGPAGTTAPGGGPGAEGMAAAAGGPGGAETGAEEPGEEGTAPGGLGDTGAGAGGPGGSGELPPVPPGGGTGLAGNTGLPTLPKPPGLPNLPTLPGGPGGPPLPPPGGLPLLPLAPPGTNGLGNGLPRKPPVLPPLPPLGGKGGLGGGPGGGLGGGPGRGLGGGLGGGGLGGLGGGGLGGGGLDGGRGIGEGGLGKLGGDQPIPRAGNETSAPAQPGVGRPPGSPTALGSTPGSATGGSPGGTPPPMMPPGAMGGAGGGGRGGKPGAGAIRPVNRKRRSADDETPGVPIGLRGKAGRSLPGAFPMPAATNRRRKDERERPAETLQLLDEELWKVEEAEAAEQQKRAGRLAT